MWVNEEGGRCVIFLGECQAQGRRCWHSGGRALCLGCWVGGSVGSELRFPGLSAGRVQWVQQALFIL